MKWGELDRSKPFYFDTLYNPSPARHYVERVVAFHVPHCVVEVDCVVVDLETKEVVHRGKNYYPFASMNYQDYYYGSYSEEDFNSLLKEIDSLEPMIGLTDSREWVRNRWKKRLESSNH